MPKTPLLVICSIVALAAAGSLLIAQPPGRGGGPGFGRGPGNPEDQKLVDRFDQNNDGWLNQNERITARASVQQNRSDQGRRGPHGPRRQQQTPKPGRKLSPDQVEQFSSQELYDNTILRTVFLEFESDDWEEELEAFNNTDVEVPATVTVDGKTYPQVGVHFRGQSSYMMVPRGSKRSLNLSFDFLNKEQRLLGYKTLNLLNSSGDASMMSAVLYSHIARDYLPAPKANFVRVVINGECWGVYANVQQYDKVFLKDNFEQPKGTRWKVPGNPRADGGLRYLGEDLAGYKQRFAMKSNDDPQAWDQLINLCRVLNETPSAQLQSKLSEVLDISETLKFLALDVALVNSDGYWTRASDYYLYCAEIGVFQLFPHDMNEAFCLARGGPPGGPPGGRGRRGRSRRPAGPPPGFGPPPGGRPPEGFGPPPGEHRGGPGGDHGSVDLDPLVATDNDRMPLRSQLLGIPALREEYLGYTQTIARDALNWDKLGPFVESQHELIRQAVKQDTKKLASYKEFETAVAGLKDFAKKRQKHLLSK